MYIKLISIFVHLSFLRQHINYDLYIVSHCKVIIYLVEGYILITTIIKKLSIFVECISRMKMAVKGSMSSVDVRGREKLSGGEGYYRKRGNYLNRGTFCPGMGGEVERE